MLSSLPVLWLLQCSTGQSYRDTWEDRLLSTHEYGRAPRAQENHNVSHEKQECMREGNMKIYSLANVILICKLLIVEAKLVNKIGRHLLHLIIRKGLATPGPVTVI